MCAVAAACVWLLLPSFDLSARQGDVQGVTAGLRRAPDGWDAGARALIHFHGLGLPPRRLVLDLSRQPSASPSRVVLDLYVGAKLVGKTLIEPRRQTVVFGLPSSGRDLDIGLAIGGEQPESGVRYRVHDIRLERGWGVWGGLRLLSVLGVLLATLVATWTRPWSRRLMWASWAMASTTALLLVGFDPAALCQLAPPTRAGLQLFGLAGLWWLTLGERGGLARTTLAVTATVAWLYLPTIHYGLVNEDFYFTRDYAPGELVHVATRSWDGQHRVAGFYRPMFVWDVAFEHRLWGNEPTGFHVTSLVLLGMCGMVGLGVLRRLGLPARPALAGTLLWIVHPLSASAAAWVAQRTDSLMLPFLLGAIGVALLGPSGRVATAGRLGLAGALAVGAFLSKEWAVMLPILASACLLARSGRQRWRQARNWGIGFALLTGAYLVWWTSIFPGRILSRPMHESLLQIPRLALGALGPIFAPTTLQRWTEATAGARWTHDLVAVTLLAALAWPAFRRGRALGRLVVLSAVWPAIMAMPLLVRDFRDFYRLGLPLAFGAAIAWGVLCAVAEARSHRLTFVLTAVAGLWLATLALDTAAAWGPAHPFRAHVQWRRDHYVNLTPAMRARLDLQHWQRTHARRWVRGGNVNALQPPGS